MKNIEVYDWCLELSGIFLYVAKFQQVEAGYFTEKPFSKREAFAKSKSAAHNEYLPICNLSDLYVHQTTLYRWCFQIFFIFTPKNWGRWTHFEEHIFQMGWFNHQLIRTVLDWHDCMGKCRTTRPGPGCWLRRLICCSSHIPSYIPLISNQKNLRPPLKTSISSPENWWLE